MKTFILFIYLFIFRFSFTKDSSGSQKEQKKKWKKRKRKSPLISVKAESGDGLPCDQQQQAHSSLNNEEGEIISQSGEASSGEALQIGTEEPYIIIQDKERDSSSKCGGGDAM